MPRKSSGPNKSDQIYHTVREDIIKGKYPGGTFIIENDLCQQFSVSRTPIREALIRLAQDRFVELIPNRGAVVPHITIGDIMEIYQLRAVNDGLAASLIARSHSDELVKDLEASVLREEALLAQEDSSAIDISTEDFVFHSLIDTNCNNRRLMEILELIDNQMHRFARAAAMDNRSKETLRRSVSFHRRTLEAIRACDADAARSCLESHWQDMLNGYIQRSLEGGLPLQF